ncbi:MAG TPA: ArsB/NhaD family transporter [Capsulimonadaceae bacterium]|nr:ArsB/NhaD family transporter [Capsulimonadaceae bacterium]
MHVALTLTVFLLTLSLMFLRPRGLSEAWAAVIGAALMLAFGLTTWRQAQITIGQGAGVLLFLFALMLLSGLLEQSGFFEWAAILAARSSRGEARILFRNVFLLGFAITALLSLDTTAIILTPIVAAFISRLRLPSKPYLIACAFVANCGSLLLPVSNLTNLLFASAFHLSFGRFTLIMALPQFAAILANYLAFRYLFRHQFGQDFDRRPIPDSLSVLPDRIFFAASLLVLGVVLIGYFAGSLLGIPPYLIALGGCAVLLLVGAARRRIAWKRLSGEISLPLFVFVIGLFVVVRGVENLGLAGIAAGMLDSGRSPLTQILISAFGAAIGANIINNIPMGLLAISIIKSAGASGSALYGALLGCNIGPNLTLAGSLATMLVITSARKRGENIGAWDFLRAGLFTTPLVLLASCLALWIALLVAR